MGEIVDELRTDGPSEEEVERARAYSAGRRVLAFENTNAVARYAASQTVIYNQDIDPDKAIAALDAVTYDQVVDVARGISDGAVRHSVSDPIHKTSSHSRRLPLGRFWATMVARVNFEELNHRELERYVRRVWTGGRSTAPAGRGASPTSRGRRQRERGPST